MKRKFINGLLLVALFVGFTGSMVSCKDYDDEKINDLKGIIADKELSLQEKIEAQGKLLQDQIDDLDTRLDNCSTTCANFRSQVELKFAEYTTLINNTNQYIADSIYTKTEIDAMLKQLEEELKAYLDEEAIARAVANQLNKGHQALVGALDTYIENNQTIKDLKAAVDAINDSLAKTAALTKSAYQLAVSNEGRITELEKRMDNAEDRLTDFETRIGNLEKFKTLIDERVTSLEGTVKTLGERVDNLETAVEVLRDDVDAARAIADAAWAQAQTNYDLITELQKNYALMIEMIEEIGGELTTLKNRMTDAEQGLEALQGTVAENKRLADELHAKMQEEIGGLAEEAERLAKEIEATKAALEEAIGIAINNTINSIELNGSYCPLFGEWAFFNDTRTNMLVAYYGEIDAKGMEFPTYDDAFSALPGSAHLNRFTDEDIDILWGSNGSVEDAEGYIFMAPGKTYNLLANDGQEGNAGTLYFTVNPATTDFSGTQFELVNSKNEVSAITLSDVQKSDHLLSHGWTRAASGTANGFYQAKATLKADDLEKVSSPDFDFNSIKDVLVDLRNSEDAFNVTNAANAIYSNLHAILPAQAMKATWEDKYGTHSFVSQYSIAATKVKPLSFAFASALDYSDHFPGLGKAEDFINRIVDKLCAGLPDLNPYDLKIDSIVLQDLDPRVIHGKETAAAEVIATFHLYIPNNHLISLGPRTVKYQMENWIALTENDEERVIHPSNPEITLTIEPAEPNEQGYNKQWVVTLSYDISDEIRHFNNYYSEDDPLGYNITKQIREYIDDVNKFLNSILNFNENLEDALRNNGIISYFENATKKFLRFMTPNKYMQPVLLVQTDKGFARLTEIPKYPSRVEAGNITFVPTTYNAEILTPAYKKFVAVTNVLKDGKSAKDGDQTCKSVLKAANNPDNGMFKVIDGGFGGTVSFAAQKGYVYEIIYSAVDYSGKVSTRKYYFKAI
jgi:predicted  nucleic acid-binding Zn-ribbon protein